MILFLLYMSVVSAHKVSHVYHEKDEQVQNNSTNRKKTATYEVW